MNTFSWIGYYTGNKTFLDLMAFKNVSGSPSKEEDISDFLLTLKPLEATSVHNVRSMSGASINGNILFASLLLKQMASLDKEEIIAKILDCVKLAVGKGSNIICLAGALGMFLPTIKSRVKEDVTFITGRNLLAATIIDNLLEVSRLKNINLEKEKISIFDASSEVGNICAEILAEKAGEILIYAKKNSNNSMLKVTDSGHNNIKIVSSAEDIVKGGRLMISTSLFLPQQAIASMEKGSVIFDAVVPHWSARMIADMRKDLVPIEASWRCGGALMQKDIKILFSEKYIPCCLAATAMLAFEKDVQGFSELTLENVFKMRRLSRKYGFSLPLVKI